MTFHCKLATLHLLITLLYHMIKHTVDMNVVVLCLFLFGLASPVRLDMYIHHSEKSIVQLDLQYN